MEERFHTENESLHLKTCSLFITPISREHKGNWARMYLRDTQDVWEPRNHMLLIVSESTKTQLEASVLQGWQGNPNYNSNDLHTEAFPGACCPHERAPQQREPDASERSFVSWPWLSSSEPLGLRWVEKQELLSQLRTGC